MNVTKSLKNIRTSVGILLQKMYVSDCNDRKSTKKWFNFYSLNEYHSAPNQLSPDVSMTCTPSEYIITITSELFVWRLSVRPSINVLYISTSYYITNWPILTYLSKKKNTLEELMFVNMNSRAFLIGG